MLAHHSPEACGGSGSGRNTTELLIPVSCQPSQTHRAFCTTHFIALGFISTETWLMSLCSGVGEHSPLCQGLAGMGELGPPREMQPQGMVVLFLPWSSLCLCRQGSRPRQKRSLRRTRAWCGSCWSSCGLAWTCHGWCCPLSSWSHAHSSTNSLTTTTMPTCSPSKQHTGWAWPGHFSCIWENIFLCARRAPKLYWGHWLQHRSSQAPAAVIFYW